MHSTKDDEVGVDKMFGYEPVHGKADVEKKMVAQLAIGIEFMIIDGGAPLPPFKFALPHTTNVLTTHASL